MTTRQQRTRRAGFTLIEVMIVIAIILALSGLVGVALFQRKEKATDSLVRIDMGNIEQAMNLFRLDYERWPTDEEGLEVLWNKEVLDPDADQGLWQKYLSKPLPKDRFGTEWGYRAESENFPEEEGMYDLWSYGRDREEGTEDDITNWESLEEDEFGDFGTPPGG